MYKFSSSSLTRFLLGLSLASSSESEQEEDLDKYFLSCFSFFFFRNLSITSSSSLSASFTVARKWSDKSGPLTVAFRHLKRFIPLCCVLIISVNEVIWLIIFANAAYRLADPAAGCRIVIFFVVYFLVRVAHYHFFCFRGRCGPCPVDDSIKHGARLRAFGDAHFDLFQSLYCGFHNRRFVVIRQPSYYSS